MKPIEEFYRILDQSDWDIKDIHTIEKCLSDIYNKIPDAEKENHRLDFKREQETFSFNKSPEGIKWRTKWGKDGSDEAVVWPDIDSLQEEDFNYVYERFKNCKNTFAKSEYGLVLFYKGKLNPDECKELYKILLELAHKYYDANKGKEKAPYYNWTFYNALANTLHISYYKRKALGFTNEFEMALHFAEQIHKEWKEAGQHMLRTVIDMTGLIVKYYNQSKAVVDINGFYERNIEASDELNKTYIWGAIYIIDENIRLNEAAGLDSSPMILKKAQLYEKLADEAVNTPRQLAAISFVETALRLYNDFGDTENIRRLEEKYIDIRGTGNFSKIKQTLPKEETERIRNLIQKEIKEKDSFGILENFMSCPMYPNINIINQNAEEWKKQSVMMYMFGMSIADKFGNIIAKYPEQSEEWAFWQSYGLSFQIGTQTLVSYFLQAIKSGKLNAESAIGFLSKTWMNEPLQRNYNQNKVEIIPLDLVKPSIEYFFSEIEGWFKSPEKKPNLIVMTDSLILKIETLLRYFCDKFEPKIPTFKQKDNGIVMERNLDEIIASLEHKPDGTSPQNTNFSEDDRRFIKFVLSEKCGENLRNRIAHGLLDAEEYSIEKAILAFTIIMRLGKYQFKKI